MAWFIFAHATKNSNFAGKILTLNAFSFEKNTRLGTIRYFLTLIYVKIPEISDFSTKNLIFYMNFDYFTSTGSDGSRINERDKRKY